MRALKSLAIRVALTIAATIAVHAAAIAQPPPYVPGELLVKFKPGIFPGDHMQLNQRIHIQKTRSMDHGRIHLFKLAPGLDIEQARQMVAKHPDVAYAEPNYILSAQTWEGDPGFDLQWALNNRGQIVSGYVGTPGSDVEALNAWPITAGSSQVVVAVVDSGITMSHPDLTANLWINEGEIPDNLVDDDGNGFIDDCHGWDFYDHDHDPSDVTGHGSHVAGIIAAKGNNMLGIAGVAWNARIMPLRFMDAFDRGSTADAIEAIRYAADQGARIINCSWGGGGNSLALRDTMAQTSALFVCAAGNTTADNDDSPFYPASFDLPNILSVAASDQMDRLAWFSNFGSRSVDVAAPGIRIYSVANDRRTLWQDGFDDGTLNGWTTGGSPDSWTVTDPPYAQNAPALATSADANYANQSDMWARPAPIDLSSASGSTLTMRVVGASQGGTDKLLIETSTDASTWVSRPLKVAGAIIDDGISGTLAYWTPVTLDLGFLDGNAKAYFRLKFISDTLTRMPGFYIDNLSVTAAAAGSTYAFMEGTSMAAGYASGVAALVLSQYPELTPLEIKATIEQSVDLNSNLHDRVLSAGRINAFNALTLIEDFSLFADATDAGTIQLSWHAPADTRIDMQATVERRTDDQTEFSAIAYVNADSGGYIDSTAAENTTYYYRIHADTGNGTNGYSNQISATANFVANPADDGSSGAGGCFIGSSGR
jgi:subtilisin family serine protease